MTYEAGSNRDIIPLMIDIQIMGEKGMVEGGSSTDHITNGLSVYLCVRIRTFLKDALSDVAQWICAANMGVVGGAEERKVE